MECGWDDDVDVECNLNVDCGSAIISSIVSASKHNTSNDLNAIQKIHIVIN